MFIDYLLGKNIDDLLLTNISVERRLHSRISQLAVDSFGRAYNSMRALHENDTGGDNERDEENVKDKIQLELNCSQTTLN